MFFEVLEIELKTILNTKNRMALQTVDLPITNTQVDMMFAFVEVVYILKYQIMARPRQKRAKELNIKYDAVVSWIFLPSKLALNFLQQINNEPC